MTKRINNVVLTSVAISVIGFAPSAFAYLDPSTGSMILSAIVGVFATVGLAVKTYWYKLKSLFRSDKENLTQTGADDSAEPARDSNN